MKLTHKQKLWLRGKATITVECLEENLPIRGNVLASGNAEEDKLAEDAVIEGLESGNEWAWCCVKVTLKWKEWEGVDYLGACSYKSKQDFVEGGNYFPDMVAQAFDGLVQHIEYACETLETLKAVL